MSGSSTSKAALLWDESFLWGIMALKALKTAALPCKVVTAEEIRQGILEDYRLLFVPGGWASNKIKSLGEEGAEAIREFVASGGNYLGFCGGAGLATQDGLGLLTVKRRPTKERVPSFSGRINLNTSDHPIWDGLPSSPLNPHPSRVFHAWWPSQFLIDDPQVRILASYGAPLPDAFSSDLNVGDVTRGGGWSRMEDLYGINLDPARLRDEPAVVEATYGKGRVIASLLHFDTPDDSNGAGVLQNLWGELRGQSTEHRLQTTEDRTQTTEGYEAGIIAEMEETVSELIELGRRNFLWFWRNPMLLQWRRGIRGLEYCTLYQMVKELAVLTRQPETALERAELEVASNRLSSFVEKAQELLVLERLAMQREHITYEKCDDQKIQALRTGLFSSSKSYGGAFKDLLDSLDALLLPLIKAESQSGQERQGNNKIL